jgi:co-chaperonin GroES (HSP10)
MAEIKGKLTAIKDRVFVTDMDDGEKVTRGGILIPGDDKTNRGIRDRWARVYMVGPEVDDLQAGDWVLVKHGRWTPGVTLDDPEQGEVKVWLVEYPESVLCIADEVPADVHPRDLAVTTSNAAPF